MNIFNEIKNLTKDEVNKYIKNRLLELKNTEKKELGFFTRNNIYRELLTKKIKINSFLSCVGNSRGLLYAETGSFKMDDNRVYKYLIDSIKENDDMYYAVYKAARKYCYPEKPMNNKEKRSTFLYKHLSASVDRAISIKILHLTKLSYCAEIAAVSHNMFKFLGIESDYVTNSFCTEGLKGGFHSFDIIYPWGRENDALIFDPAIENNKYPPMFYLDRKKKNNLLNHKYILLGSYDVTKANKVLFNKDTVTNMKDRALVIMENGYVETILEYEKELETAKKLSLKREL